MSKWSGFIIEDSLDLEDPEIVMKVEQYLEEEYETIMGDLISNEPKLIEFLGRKTWKDLDGWCFNKSLRQHLIDQQLIEDEEEESA